MSKFKLISVFAILMTQLTFSAVKINCGDVNKGYTETDFSATFKEDFYSESDQEFYNKQGYKYHIAGRNCALNHWQNDLEFEVLFLFEKKDFYGEALNLGPFTIKGAMIEIADLNLEDLLEDELYLAGDDKDSLMGINQSTSATLELKRGKGKVGIIIRKK